ncbi:MAG: DoxX family protein [Ignavibacteriaceae bacterium]|nr:DoxX family protein [Ignavibacteriaceae bacterium]
MADKRTVIVKIILILSGLMFLFSAVSKSMPIQSFELFLVSKGLFNWETAPLFSRLIVSFEFFLGILLLVNLEPKRAAIPLSLVMLVVFTVHLVYDMIISGNTGNCGCFGELLPMTPLEAVIKNVLFGGALAYTYKSIELDKNRRLALSFGVYPVIVILSLLIFGWPSYTSHKEKAVADKELNSKTQQKKDITEKDTVQKAEETVQKKDTLQIKAETKPIKSREQILLEKYPPKTSIYGKFKNFSTGSLDPDQGVKLVAFLSLDCDHCLDVATRLTKMKGMAGNAQYLFYCFGEEEQRKEFYSKSGSSAPYRLMKPVEFFPYLSQSPPKLVLLVNGNVIDEWEGDEADTELVLRKIRDLEM